MAEEKKTKQHYQDTVQMDAMSECHIDTDTIHWCQQSR